MRAVLGIDAAWTEKNPSGVALAVETSKGWELVAVESSYQNFVVRSEGNHQFGAKPVGSKPEPKSLLKAAERLCKKEVNLVAVDMPMSMAPISERRASDNAVSKAYGGRKCSTHSPNSRSPGAINNAFRQEFGEAGYPLLTSEIADRGLVEVYPHPALVELARAPERLKYKSAKRHKYWPEHSTEGRKQLLLMAWSQIIELMNNQIIGVASAFIGYETRLSGAEMKATEDALDAVVCAWVAICVLEGRAIPFGDHESAIWIPKPQT